MLLGVVGGLVLALIVWLLLDIRSLVAKGPNRKGAPVTVMDTSALIDARVVDIVASGFMQSTIVIPKVVLNELQLLADGRDTHKRTRARRGLEAAQQLSDSSIVQVVTIDAVDDHDSVDNTVLQIAKKRAGRLCTTDYNLQKVAEAEGVTVCNVHELLHRLRPSVLPGETVSIKITHKGEAKRQGVGYLSDGSMVVVENAHRKVGASIKVTVSKITQTQSGHMVFARVKS